MAATKIMIIRHAEKPEGQDEGPEGVSLEGTPDPEELIVRGWQRAGALARFFAPKDGHFVDAHLAIPQVIFASQVAHHSRSLRPQHTVKLLADLLQKKIVLDYAKGDEEKLAAAAIAANGTVLISWEHEKIPEIGQLITGNDKTCPETWDGSRFDLVWVFDRPSGAADWTFAAVAQMLLSGDRADTSI